MNSGKVCGYGSVIARVRGLIWWITKLRRLINEKWKFIWRKIVESGFQITGVKLALRRVSSVPTRTYNVSANSYEYSPQV